MHDHWRVCQPDLGIALALSWWQLRDHKDEAWNIARWKDKEKIYIERIVAHSLQYLNGVGPCQTEPAKQSACLLRALCLRKSKSCPVEGKGCDIKHRELEWLLCWATEDNQGVCNGDTECRDARQTLQVPAVGKWSLVANWRLKWPSIGAQSIKWG